MPHKCRYEFGTVKPLWISIVRAVADTVVAECGGSTLLIPKPATQCDPVFVPSNSDPFNLCP
jgi:hypothetical protein